MLHFAHIPPSPFSALDSKLRIVSNTQQLCAMITSPIAVSISKGLSARGLSSSIHRMEIKRPTAMLTAILCLSLIMIIDWPMNSAFCTYFEEQFFLTAFAKAKMYPKPPTSRQKPCIVALNRILNIPSASSGTAGKHKDTQAIRITFGVVFLNVNITNTPPINCMNKISGVITTEQGWRHLPQTPYKERQIFSCCQLAELLE